MCQGLKALAPINNAAEPVAQTAEVATTSQGIADAVSGSATVGSANVGTGSEGSASDTAGSDTAGSDTASSDTASNGAASNGASTTSNGAANNGAASNGAASNGAASSEGVREDHRLAILERGSLAVGQKWAMSVVGAFNAEQRPPAGGWPATLSEARGQVELGLTTWLRRHGYSPLKPAEASQAIRLVYAAARREWLARRMPEPRT